MSSRVLFVFPEYIQMIWRTTRIMLRYDTCFVYSWDYTRHEECYRGDDEGRPLHPAYLGIHLMERESDVEAFEDKVVSLIIGPHDLRSTSANIQILYKGRVCQGYCHIKCEDLRFTKHTLIGNAPFSWIFYGFH